MMAMMMMTQRFYVTAWHIPFVWQQMDWPEAYFHNIRVYQSTLFHLIPPPPLLYVLFFILFVVAVFFLFILNHLYLPSCGFDWASARPSSGSRLVPVTYIQSFAIRE